MKALTLTQPWATLVAIGVKRFETRSWQTSYRGVLAIHASASYPRACRALAAMPAFRYALRHVPGPLPRGMVLATCELMSVRRTDEFYTQLDLIHAGGDSMLSQFQFGDFAPGRFAFGLSGIMRLPAPIPAKGALSLWEWDGGPSHL